MFVLIILHLNLLIFVLILFLYQMVHYVCIMYLIIKYARPIMCLLRLLYALLKSQTSLFRVWMKESLFSISFTDYTKSHCPASCIRNSFFSKTSSNTIWDIELEFSRRVNLIQKCISQILGSIPPLTVAKWPKFKK